MQDLLSQHEWHPFNKQIAVIGNKNEFLTRSLVELCRTNQFDVHQCNATVTHLSQIPPEYVLYLIVIDTLDDMESFLIYLKDIVIDRQICPCFICEKDASDVIIKHLSEDNIAKVFLRPVNVRHIVAELNEIYIMPMHQKGQHSILVVDDDPEYLKHIQQILRPHYKIYLASSGAAALMIIAKHKPDLILLDYRMPVLDGLKTMEVLQSETTTASIPVMFVTSTKDPELVQQVLKFKPVKYLLKSSSVYTFLKTLEDFFADK